MIEQENYRDGTVETTVYKVSYEGADQPSYIITLSFDVLDKNNRFLVIYTVPPENMELTDETIKEATNLMLLPGIEKGDALDLSYRFAYSLEGVARYVLGRKRPEDPLERMAWYHWQLDEDEFKIIQ